MIRAKVIAETSVHNLARKIGDEVEVDADTFRNLAKKGRLELVEGEPVPPVSAPSSKGAPRRAR